MPLDKNEVPCERVGDELIPATDRGWKERLVYEKPILVGGGRIELRQYIYDRDNFRCRGCKTTKYTLLKLIGHDYRVRRPAGFVYGTGTFKRCFKCDTTSGPIGEDEYPEVKVLEENISRSRAKAIVRKYGLHNPRIMELKE